MAWLLETASQSLGKRLVSLLNDRPWTHSFSLFCCMKVWCPSTQIKTRMEGMEERTTLLMSVLLLVTINILWKKELLFLCLQFSRLILGKTRLEWKATCATYLTVSSLFSLFVSWSRREFLKHCSLPGIQSLRLHYSLWRKRGGGGRECGVSSLEEKLLQDYVQWTRLLKRDTSLEQVSSLVYCRLLLRILSFSLFIVNVCL